MGDPRRNQVDPAPRHDEGSADELLALQYDHLRALACQWFGEQPASHTLQPTALVHEAYLRLADCGHEQWKSRTHFFAIAATAMRQVLVDYARRRQAAKRGRHWCKVSIGEIGGHGGGEDVDLNALSEALDRLSKLNPRQCRIVELRFLAGLTVDETAGVLGVSTRTVKLDWRMARAWLLGELRRG